MEPQLLIPAAFLNETLMAIRTESAAQTRLLANHYSNLKQDYNGIREDFRSCVHQTDRILAEQYSRFELKLEDIQKSMLQFHENQTAAIADLRARLDAIEGLTKGSKDAVASKITAIVETMGRGIDGLLAVIKPNVCGKQPRLLLVSTSRPMHNSVHRCSRHILFRKRSTQI